MHILKEYVNCNYKMDKKLLQKMRDFDIVERQIVCGSDSVVECHLAKVKVAGPNPVSRSKYGTMAKW